MGEEAAAKWYSHGTVGQLVVWQVIGFEVYATIVVLVMRQFVYGGYYFLSPFGQLFGIMGAFIECMLYANLAFGLERSYSVTRRFRDGIITPARTYAEKLCVIIRSKPVRWSHMTEIIDVQMKLCATIPFAAMGHFRFDESLFLSVPSDMISHVRYAINQRFEENAIGMIATLMALGAEMKREFPDGTDLSLQVEVDTIRESVAAIHSMNLAPTPTAYDLELSVVTYSFVALVPVLLFTPEYWWMVLVFYPLVVYMFIGFYSLGKRLRSRASCDFNADYTYAPVEQWCEHARSDIGKLFDNLGLGITFESGRLRDL
jgi:predicted membrane chloride channel (bestrophin family)